VTATNNVPRNTVAEVYAQIISDLTTAEAKLPASNSFFSTKYSAAALLSRVYLQQGRYTEAAAANRVIASGAYALDQDYADEFYQGTDLVSTTTEDIFTVQNTAQSGSNSGSNQLSVFYSQFQRGDVSINDQLLNQSEANNDRKKLFTVTTNQTYSDKYDGQYGTV
jgi:hypothetical protein